MTKDFNCTICHLTEFDDDANYHKLKCALCKIWDRAQTACDDPENTAGATESLKFILTTASVALILDLLPMHGKAKK